jgi:hypothetical protein
VTWKTADRALFVASGVLRLFLIVTLCTAAAAIGYLILTMIILVFPPHALQ